LKIIEAYKIKEGVSVENESSCKPSIFIFMRILLAGAYGGNVLVKGSSVFA
jgi:hypothetical protein